MWSPRLSVWELTLSLHAHGTDSQPCKQPGTSFIVCSENKPWTLVSFLHNIKIKHRLTFCKYIKCSNHHFLKNILKSLEAIEVVT